MISNKLTTIICVLVIFVVILKVLIFGIRRSGGIEDLVSFLAFLRLVFSFWKMVKEHKR